ncbi:MAG: hypothetical protein KIT72_07955 [Polyangiaceae bacterium]|nr:hypothetical protein [Polyangiaceae bacterium]MCW5790339.1 hypothetical protein [Polyangiaceae bacterium]
MKTLLTSSFVALSCILVACGGDATGSLDDSGDGVGRGAGARAGSSSGSGGSGSGGSGTGGWGAGGSSSVAGSAGTSVGGSGQGGRVIEPGAEDTTDAILQFEDAPYLPGQGSGGQGGTGSGWGGSGGSWVPASGAAGGTDWGSGGSGWGAQGGAAGASNDLDRVRLVWGNDHRSCDERWVYGCGTANATAVFDTSDLYAGARIDLLDADGFISQSGPDRGGDDCWGGGGTLQGELEVLRVDLNAEIPFMVYQVTGTGNQESNVDGVFTAYWCF